MTTSPDDAASAPETPPTDAPLPAPEHIINDLETLKVLADPLRLSILDHVQAPSTVKVVAQRLGRPPTKLYYHFNLLEKHGIIQVVETRIVSGIVEKQYQATARRYRLAYGLLSPQHQEFDERFDVMLSGLFGAARQQAYDSLVRGTVQTAPDAPRYRRLLLKATRAMLEPAQAEAFIERMEALLDEFGFRGELHEQDAPEQLLYRLTLMLHPVDPNTAGNTPTAPEETPEQP